MSHAAASSDVFRSHSYNLPHLHTWVDEIIRLTDQTSSASRKHNTSTEDLVQSLHRYDAVFRELLRQTVLFSGELTKLYGKLWTGVLKLLDGMVKIYHRHVTQTSSLQDQARELIRQRHAQVAATKIDKEQGTLERTALRANIRNLEAEVLALKTSNRELDRDNRGLRLLVDTYIDGRDFDQSGLALVATDRDDLSAKRSRSLLGSFEWQKDLVSSFDVQMNERLVSIEDEEDRQKTVVQQLAALLGRNKELIQAYKLQYEDRSSICGMAPPPKMVHAAIQVVPPHIRRTSAVLTAQSTCDRWGLEGSSEFVMKVRAMPNAKGAFYVDLDEFLEIAVEQWVLVRTCWVSHAAYLFQYNSSLFKVQFEAQFAVEGCHADRDAVLVQVTKDAAALSGSRTTPRLLQEAAASAARKIAQREKYLRPAVGSKEEVSSVATATTGGGGGGEEQPPKVNSKQQSKSAGNHSNLVQLIPLKKFYLMMRMVKPGITNEQVEMYFEACQEYTTSVLRRDLGRMWLRCEGQYDDGEGVLEQLSYYYNRVTGHSQWKLPFRMKTFHSMDISVDAFIHVMLTNGVMESSPLHVFYHLAPADLWPNTEIFYKEQEHTRGRLHSSSGTRGGRVGGSTASPKTDHRKKPTLSEE